MQWLANQILAASSRTGLRLDAPRYNPRPAGVIRDGSATQAVLVFLRENPKQFFSHFQIVKGTGRSYKSVNWAMLFLRSQHLVDCVPDAQRNSRYLRYRAAPINDRRSAP
jgi:hypothetical protein